MTRKQKKMLARIGVSFALYLAGIVFEHVPAPDWVHVVLLLVSYAIISYDVLRKSIKNISHGQIFDENFLMAVASIGAILLGQLDEAVAVMLFYQVGEWFQSYAVNKSRKSIADLMDIQPTFANLEVDDKIEEVDPETVEPGQVIVIQPGERVPLDGEVLEGTSSLDTAALTGESVPRTVRLGSQVISGCINQAGVLKVKVTKPYADSTVARILELVENATDKKAPAEQFITKFARVYTPAVCACAAALAVIPSLVDGNWSQWIYRALTFLVISCPCALVISVPMSFFGGIGGASRAGILVKGSTYLETMSKVKTIVFDKTGTLTKGTFQVTDVIPADGYTSEEVLQYAAALESYSSHPIARSIVSAASPELDKAENVKEIAGHGIEGTIANKTVKAGNAKLMTMQVPANTGIGTVVYVEVDGKYAGRIEISDEIKADTATAITLLKKYGIKKCVMLTGDTETVAQKVADKTGIDEVHANLLPQDKVADVQKLIDTSSAPVAFVGDGINDAPVLATADLGIAMGALGSDAAIEAADIVLMEDRLSQIVTCMAISTKTMKIVWQNIAFAIGIKLLVLVLGALGYANMWAAVFADVGVAFLCILNAMRALQVPKVK